MVGNDAACRARLYRKARARIHHTGVEAAVICDDSVYQLVIVVNGDGVAGLSMNRGGNEDVMLHDCFRNRSTAAAEIQVRPEDIVPLRSNISGSRRKGQTPAREMAKGATAGTRRRCCSGAVGPVRAVLPFTISKLLI